MKRVAGHLVPPLALFVLLFVLHPYRNVFSFDPDEGNNLIKARLVADGHALYSDVWSDQPPLMTHALHAWMTVGGWTVESARLLILLCSCVLLWSLYRVVRTTAGHVGAALACGLLIVSFGYVRLSVSVMLGIPSLMLAVLAVQAALRGRLDGRGWWAALSGVALALSLAVKMWTLMLVPVVVGTALLAAGQAEFKVGLRPIRRAAVAWVAGFVATLGVVVLTMVPLGELGQLFAPHLDVRRPGGFDESRFWMHLVDDLGLVLLAIVGTLGAVRRRDWIGVAPAAWAVSAMLVLLWHQPVWYHHYLILSIPLCWAAGQVAPELLNPEWLDTLRQWRRSRSVQAWATGLVAFVAVVLTVRLVPQAIERDFTAWSLARSSTDEALVDALVAKGDRTEWIMTDRQILAFRADLRVPPPLAVTSLKRHWSGHLSDIELIETLQQYTPEQVYLSGRRMPMTGPLRMYLADRYERTIAGPQGAGLFVRSDVEKAYEDTATVSGETTTVVEPR